MSKVKKVAFICLANACRSQIAEGLLRAIADKNIQVFSAGISPLGIIPKDIYTLMKKKQIPITDQYSKGFDKIPLEHLDLLISLTGESMLDLAWPLFTGIEIIWDISDPFRGSPSAYAKAFDMLEKQIRELLWILNFNS